MMENKIKNWQKIRAQGKFRFIFVKGAIFLGILATIINFVLMRAFDYFFDYSSFLKSDDNLTVKLIFNFLIWALAGSIIRWLEWDAMERKSL